MSNEFILAKKLIKEIAEKSPAELIELKRMCVVANSKKAGLSKQQIKARAKQIDINQYKLFR